uniref:BZIP domain-containing protein n=1 Tax=Salix viminalis TaxID=40686 RepID=A0A6N2M455_SALVM
MNFKLKSLHLVAEGKSYEMEGAASSLSEIKFWQNFLDIEQVFAEPSPSVTSAELASNPFQNTTETNRKRKVSGATRDAAAEKKRLVDKEYRTRCKERKMKMEKTLDALSIENDRLRGENDYLKNQETQLAQTLQRQKDEMKKLEKEFVQLKGQLHKQNTVLEVLPKLLGGSNEDLHRENAQLKLDINLLTRQINNPESLNAIKLRAKIARMENEKHSLEGCWMELHLDHGGCGVAVGSSLVV